MVNHEQTIINAFSMCSNIEELKKCYIQLIKEYHPDKGGCLEICQLVNTLYEQFANKLKNLHEHKKQEQTETEEKAEYYDISEAMRDVIFTLSSFPLDLEICGSWLWVTGRTWLYTKQLKTVGCIFASRKKAWCYHEEEWNRKNKHKLSLDEIRSLHGSVKISNKFNHQLSRG